jgi:hypothetical protein
MSPVGLETKNHRADEGQQKFGSQSEKESGGGGGGGGGGFKMD